MSESDWNECLENQAARTVSKDRQKAESLIRTAKARLEFFRNYKHDKPGANYVFEGIYTSTLEMLHALLILEGYQVNNHICLGHYLRDILKNGALYSLFDDARKKRNLLLYYGKEMDPETAEQTIKNTKRLVSELQKELDKRK
jgi:uncharacterized protein (UPF0332 family)